MPIRKSQSSDSGLTVIDQKCGSRDFLIRQHLHQPTSSSNGKSEQQKPKSSSKNRQKCSQCKGVEMALLVTPCNHVFCAPCILSRVMQDSKCPYPTCTSNRRILVQDLKLMTQIRRHHQPPPPAHSPPQPPHSSLSNTNSTPPSTLTSTTSSSSSAASSSSYSTPPTANHPTANNHQQQSKATRSVSTGPVQPSPFDNKNRRFRSLHRPTLVLDWQNRVETPDFLLLNQGSSLNKIEKLQKNVEKMSVDFGQREQVLMAEISKLHTALRVAKSLKSSLLLSSSSTSSIPVAIQQNLEYGSPNYDVDEGDFYDQLENPDYFNDNWKYEKLEIHIQEPYYDTRQLPFQLVKGSVKMVGGSKGRMRMTISSPSSPEDATYHHDYKDGKRGDAEAGYYYYNYYYVGKVFDDTCPFHPYDQIIRVNGERLPGSLEEAEAALLLKRNTGHRTTDSSGEKKNESSSKDNTGNLASGPEKVVVEVIRRTTTDPMQTMHTMDGGHPTHSIRMTSTTSSSHTTIATQTDPVSSDDEEEEYGEIGPLLSPTALPLHRLHRHHRNTNNQFIHNRDGGKRPDEDDQDDNGEMKRLELEADRFIDDETDLEEQLENVEYEEISLERSSSRDKLGLTLCYGNGEDIETDIFVSEVDPDSIAGKDCRIRPGDQILQINSVDVVTRNQAIDLFRQEAPVVTLLLARSTDNPNVMEDAEAEVAEGGMIQEVVYDDELGALTDATRESAGSAHEKDSGISRTTDSDNEFPPPISSPISNLSGRSSGTGHSPTGCCDSIVGLRNDHKVGLPPFPQQQHQQSTTTTSDAPDTITPGSPPVTLTDDATFGGHPSPFGPHPGKLASSSARSTPASEHPPPLPPLPNKLIRADSDGSLERELASLHREMETVRLECDRLIAQHASAEEKVLQQMETAHSLMATVDNLVKGRSSSSTTSQSNSSSVDRKNSSTNNSNTNNDKGVVAHLRHHPFNNSQETIHPQQQQQQSSWNNHNLTVAEIRSNQQQEPQSALIAQVYNRMNEQGGSRGGRQQQQQQKQYQHQSPPLPPHRSLSTSNNYSNSSNKDPSTISPAGLRRQMMERGVQQHREETSSAYNSGGESCRSTPLNMGHHNHPSSQTYHPSAQYRIQPQQQHQSSSSPYKSSPLELNPLRRLPASSSTNNTIRANFNVPGQENCATYEFVLTRKGGEESPIREWAPSKSISGKGHQKLPANMGSVSSVAAACPNDMNSIPSSNMSLNQQQNLQFTIGDTMYTNPENLEETIMMQQKLLRQAMIAQAQQLKQQLPDGNSKGPLNTPEKVEWKIKRRSDGSRYVTKRPVRNKLLKERAEQLSNERAGVSTDDDAFSELKVGRYWTREEKKRHVEKSRERKRRQEELIRRKATMNPPTTSDQQILYLSHKKQMRKKPQQLFDKFTTVQEFLAHGNRIHHDYSKTMGILSVTTV